MSVALKGACAIAAAALTGMDRSSSFHRCHLCHMDAAGPPQVSNVSIVELADTAAHRRAARSRIGTIACPEIEHIRGRKNDSDRRDRRQQIRAGSLNSNRLHLSCGHNRPQSTRQILIRAPTSAAQLPKHYLFSSFAASDSHPIFLYSTPIG